MKRPKENVLKSMFRLALAFRIRSQALLPSIIVYDWDILVKHCDESGTESVLLKIKTCEKNNCSK